MPDFLGLCMIGNIIGSDDGPFSVLVVHISDRDQAVSREVKILNTSVFIKPADSRCLFSLAFFSLVDLNLIVAIYKINEFPVCLDDVCLINIFDLLVCLGVRFRALTRRSQRHIAIVDTRDSIITRYFSCFILAADRKPIQQTGLVDVADALLEFLLIFKSPDLTVFNRCLIFR